MAVAVFAIPTGIFGAGFENMIQARKRSKEEEASLALDGEDNGDGESLPLNDFRAAAENGSNSDIMSGLDYGRERPPGLSFLNTKTREGQVYRYFLLAVVVMDVMAFFASTLGYLQVMHKTEGSRGVGPRSTSLPYKRFLHGGDYCPVALSTFISGFKS